MSSPILEVCDAHFAYLGKFPALCGADLTIAPGEKIAVIGANGSGKSTLLHLLDGLIFPDRGSVRVLGEELAENAFRDDSFSKYFRGKVGLVFQNPDIQLFCPTVREDIVFGPLQLGVAKPEIEKHLEELVTLLELKELLDRAPHQLSVGEKRRVAIASVLSMDPDIILLDEPTAGLDPSTTRHILDFLIQANAKGKTIVTSTHDLHIVEEIADRVYVFGRDKKIARVGNPGELLDDTEFLRTNNLIHLHAHSHGGKVHVHPHRHADHHP